MIGLSGSALLGLATAAIGLATALGVAIAILFAYFRKTTKDILREDNADLRTRLGTVEKAEEECNIRLARAEATIKTLTDVVTGASAVAELKELVDYNHKTLISKLDQIITR